MCKCLERSIEPNKLKANGDKALKEFHVEYRGTHNKSLAYYSVTTRTSLRAASTFWNSLFRSIRAERNKYANCYFQVLLITSPLCFQRGHVVARKRERKGLEDEMYTYSSYPTSLNPLHFLSSRAIHWDNTANCLKFTV